MSRTVTAFLFVSLAACGGADTDKLADKAGEKAVAAMIDAASQGKVKVQGDQIKVEGEDGQQMQIATAAQGLKQPAWWPQDVYLPEGATIAHISQQQASRILAAQVPQPGAALHEAISQAMLERGWSTTRSAIAADGAGMVGFAKDGREVSVMLSPARRGESGTMATYSVRDPSLQ